MNTNEIITKLKDDRNRYKLEMVEVMTAIQTLNKNLAEMVVEDDKDE